MDKKEELKPATASLRLPPPPPAKGRPTQLSNTGFNSRYQKLNPEQRQAVDAVDGVVMVLAGPGTGKTELLATRVANIVKQTKISPHNILCLTFTESGVAAMKNRLASIMGPAGYQVAVHTFHSFCNRVIQENPEVFSFSTDLLAITDSEKIKIFENIIKKLPATSSLKPFGNPVLYLKDIASCVSQLKQENISAAELTEISETTKKFLAQFAQDLEKMLALKPKERTAASIEKVRDKIFSLKGKYKTLAFHFELLEEMFADWEEKTMSAENDRAASALRTKIKNDLSQWYKKLDKQIPKHLELAQAYDQYQAALQENGWYDFDDMIINVLHKFQEDADLLADYQEQFQYFLVDEYQDTNGAQNELLTLLTTQHDEPNLFVVGDDKQAIFRFQGASVENLVQLSQRFPENLKTIALTANYRSQQNILDAAHDLISHNDSGLPETVVELQAKGENKLQPIREQIYQNQTAERQGTARKIKNLIENGTAPEEIALLFRTNKDAKVFAESLQQEKIPVSIELDEDILDQPAIVQIVSALRFLSAPSEEGLARIINLGWLFADPVAALKLQITANKEKQTLVQALTSEQPGWLEKISQWQSDAQSKTVPDFLAEFLNETFLPKKVKEEPTLLPKVRALFEESKRLLRQNKNLSLKDFVEHLDFLDTHDLTIEDASPQIENAVRILTAHKAKGLEFLHVFVPNMIDKTWGNMRARSGLSLPHGLLAHEKVSLDKNEDERRLFYVALTRARQQVVLSRPVMADKKKENVPSFFLNEIPAHLMQQENVLAQDTTEDAQPKLATGSLASSGTEKFVKSLLQNYTMSVTHLNNYLRCPKLFYYSNVLRLPAIKTKYMALGTAVHAALNDVFVDPSKNLLPQFEKHLKKEMLNQADYKDSLAMGKDILAKYHEHYQQDWSQNVLTEYNFKHHNVMIGEARITGLLDKIEILDEQTKQINVVDYKTGQPDNKRAELKPGGEYHRQLAFYKLLCENSKKFEYKFVSGEIDFIQQNRAGKFVKKKFEISEEETKEVAELIQATWKEISELKFLAAEKHCGKCEYCELGL